MVFSFPPDAVIKGFVVDGLGTHSSRTIMLTEVTLLFSSCPASTSYQEYKQSIIENNILLKQTEATREKSLRYLRELYGLHIQIPIFRALRDLWSISSEAQPMLALLCSLGRDPSLRASVNIILEAQVGQKISSEMISTSINTNLSSLLSPDTLRKIGRNTASSWTQSGHLSGRTNKIRVKAQAHPSSCAYALFLGYLCGERGEGLFHTPWAEVLDTPVYTLHNLAKAAAQYGWLEYRQSGSITDISFRYLLREKGD